VRARCADAPGRALEALEEGLPGIILKCADAAFAAVAQIASARRVSWIISIGF